MPGTELSQAVNTWLVGLGWHLSLGPDEGKQAEGTDSHGLAAGLGTLVAWKEEIEGKRP